MMRTFGWLAGLMVLCALFAAQEARADWQVASGFTDAEGKWTSKEKASDGDPALYGVDQSNRAGDGAVLRMTFGDGIYADQFRFNADRWTGAVDYVVVKVYYGGANPTTSEFTFYALKNGQPVAETAADGYPNAAYKTVAITPGIVTAVEFKFHYTRSGYYFWLYECQLFRQVPPVQPPAGLTLDPTSVNSTSAVFQGQVQSDGGGACKARFEYGLTATYGSFTPWVENLGTGNGITAYVSGLETGKQYHFRIQVQNSAGTVAGQDKSFVACQEESEDGALWVRPAGNASDYHTYDGVTYGWETPEAAYDDWDASAARCYHMVHDAELWSPYLYLHPKPGLYNGLRFKAAKPDNFIDTIQVEIQKSEGWVEVYKGPFAHNVFEVKPFDLYPIMDCRVRFHMSQAGVGAYWTLYEFDFRQIGVNLISPGVPYYREEAPGVFIAKDGAASPLTFKFGPGVELLTSGTVTVTKSDNLKLFVDEGCTTELAKLTYDLAVTEDRASFAAALLNKTLYVKPLVISAAARDAFVACELSESGSAVFDRVNYTIILAEFQDVDFQHTDVLYPVNVVLIEDAATYRFLSDVFPDDQYLAEVADFLEYLMWLNSFYFTVYDASLTDATVPCTVTGFGFAGQQTDQVSTTLHKKAGYYETKPIVAYRAADGAPLSDFAKDTYPDYIFIDPIQLTGTYAEGRNKADAGTVNLFLDDPTNGAIDFTKNKPENDDDLDKFMPGTKASDRSPAITVNQAGALVPQELKLRIPFKVDAVTNAAIKFEMKDFKDGAGTVLKAAVSKHPGYAMNASFTNTANNEDDFSFAGANDQPSVTVGKTAWVNGVFDVSLFCKDYAASCVLHITGTIAFTKGGKAGTFTIPDDKPVVLVLPKDSDYDGLADHWEKYDDAGNERVYADGKKVGTQLKPDEGVNDEALEPKTVGNYTLKGPGDGIKNFNEYRGYVLHAWDNNAKRFSDKKHTRLNPLARDMLVEFDIMQVDFMGQDLVERAIYEVQQLFYISASINLGVLLDEPGLQKQDFACEADAVSYGISHRNAALAASFVHFIVANREIVKAKPLCDVNEDEFELSGISYTCSAGFAFVNMLVRDFQKMLGRQQLTDPEKISILRQCVSHELCHLLGAGHLALPAHTDDVMYVPPANPQDILAYANRVISNSTIITAATRTVIDLTKKGTTLEWQRPYIVETQPKMNDAAVAPTDTITVKFSHAMREDPLISMQDRVVWVFTDQGAVAVKTLSLDASKTVLTVKLNAPMAAATRHKFVIDREELLTNKLVKEVNGEQLEVQFVGFFKTQ